MELEKMKEDYSKLVKKHNLPSFDSLNRDFEIERISIETDFLLRAIRKSMMDKIVGWLRFFEMFLVPQGAPRIYMGYLKNMSPEDKNDIDYIYQALGSINISALQLEVNYSEKEEIEMIKKIVEKMDSLRPMMSKVIKNIENPKIHFRKEKSYFG
jgi:hypothetical protein